AIDRHQRTRYRIDRRPPKAPVGPTETMSPHARHLISRALIALGLLQLAFLGLVALHSWMIDRDEAHRLAASATRVGTIVFAGATRARPRATGRVGRIEIDRLRPAAPA